MSRGLQVLFCFSLFFPAGQALAGEASRHLPMIGDIYWETAPAVSAPQPILSDSGAHQYEEAVESCLLGDADLAAGWLHLLPQSPEDENAGKPMIAIVIDDVGVDRKRSARAIDLPFPVTLSFLPYSHDIRGQTERAAQKGHELMVHLPMQPDRSTADPGPDYLGVEMTEVELRRRVEANLAVFSGYDGVNNHMGSKFTRDRAGTAVLMDVLKSRNLFFLDSKTSPDSVAEDSARADGIRTTHRDVFIDHVESPERVQAALEQIERVATRTGAAVAIGHPKDVTLEALERWLPTLAEKGFQLVPLATIIAARNNPSPPVRQDQGMAKLEPPSSQGTVIK